MLERQRASIGHRLSQRASSTAYRATHARPLSSRYAHLLDRRQHSLASLCGMRAARGTGTEAGAMSHPDFVAALLDSLDDETLAAVAERLRPHLSTATDRHELISSRQAAQALGLNERSVVRMAREGRIPGAVKIGRRWRFPGDSLVVHPPGRPSPSLSPRAARASVAAHRMSVNAIRGELT